MWYWLKCLSSIRQIITVLPHSSAEGNETLQVHGPYLTRYNGDNRSLSMQYDTRILFLCHSKRTLDDLLAGPVSKGRKDRPALSISPLHSLWNNLVVCQFLQYVPCLPRGISHWPSVGIWTKEWFVVDNALGKKGRRLYPDSGTLARLDSIAKFWSPTRISMS